MTDTQLFRDQLTTLIGLADLAPEYPHGGSLARTVTHLRRLAQNHLRGRTTHEDNTLACDLPTITTSKGPMALAQSPESQAYVNALLESFPLYVGYLCGWEPID